MALVVVTTGDDATPTMADGAGAVDRDPARMFAAICAHYRRTGFLYAEKLEHLQPVLERLQVGWPLYLDAPAELFQFHAAVRPGQETRIVSSICAYRDTNETYVVQHAASEARDTHTLLACISSCLTRINADPGFQFASMYFQPGKDWPADASKAIARKMPPDRTASHTSHYLVCDLAEAMVRMPDGVADLQPAEYAAAVELAYKAVEPMHAAWLGFPPRAQAQQQSAQPGGRAPAVTPEPVPDLTLRALNQRYQAADASLGRSRRVLAVHHRDGALAGLALCHSTPYPMNFSFLCGRTELLVPPDAPDRENPDRENLVRLLARASIAAAAARGEKVTVLLADAGDVPAATAAGYVATKKQYTCFTWMREGADGAPHALEGVKELYNSKAEGRARRQQG